MTIEQKDPETSHTTAGLWGRKDHSMSGDIQSHIYVEK
jgi:hypothetical protein